MAPYYSAVRSTSRTVVLGLGILLLGAVFTVVRAGHGAGQEAISLVGVVGLSIGGSIIASAVVTQLLANQVFGIDVRDAVEALRGSSAFARSNQTLTITLEARDGQLRALRQHEFNLEAASPFPRRLAVSIYTDVTDRGGFQSIIEPDGVQLSGSELASYVNSVEGKAQFEKRYWFRPHERRRFAIETLGWFRPTDRLIWTVEHISSDFEVRILDGRKAASGISVKINHHRRSEIAANLERYKTADGEVVSFAFLGAVLPFQGFEVQWRDD